MNAQCVETTNCETLGYTETSCNGGKGVKCPFGNKWACLGANEEECMNLACDKLGFKYTCTGTGYAGGGESACNGKYNYCNCASGYEWKNGSCQISPVPCTIGTLYYEDNQCYTQKIDGKKLLGIVVYNKTATENGWVMVSRPVASTISWGTWGTSGTTSKKAADSCSNTASLVAKGSTYKAAIAANNYTAGGKKWCLPAYDILDSINNSDNFTKINNGLSISGGLSLGYYFSSGNYFIEQIWTSTEDSEENAWYCSINTKGKFQMFLSDKGNFNYKTVRPVFAF